MQAKAYHRRFNVNAFKAKIIEKICICICIYMYLFTILYFLIDMRAHVYTKKMNKRKTNAS